ncbi:DUF2680 domain-containing protein [Anaerovorax sp. IOR16]|uniref:DUF2680 domain-containing protein n=2 Tax=Anaerovorax sp. IOR16 TaxID=2773458 RepID=UPI0019D03E29|nr:DUF2680 domain-containing protein [Anaerovorax sp. IOR16]
MKRTKIALTVGMMVLALGATSLTAFAASNYKTPAEAVAALTGKTVESVVSEKTANNVTYGSIAKDAGKLEEFKQEQLQMKKDILEKRVADGTMTQERAEEIIAAIEENQLNCDGTGNAKIGQRMGAGFGSMNGNGQGQGNGPRNGQGKGQGRGLRNGSCQVSEN